MIGSSAPDTREGDAAVQHVDASRLAALHRELMWDLPATLRFVGDFVDAWDARRARILDDARRADFDDAEAALLSLSTSSTMVGATLLAETARELHADVRRTRAMPPPRVERLLAVGAATCAELADLSRRRRIQPAESNPPAVSR